MTEDKKIKRYVESHGGEVPLFLTPTLARIVEKSGAHPDSWVKIKPIPLKKEPPNQ